MLYKIAVQWMEVGEFEVEAENLELAMLMVDSNENDQFPIGKANGEYLDDSFEVNKDVTEELNKSE